MKKGGLPGRLNRLKQGDVLFLLTIFLIFLILLRDSYNYPSESRSFPQLIILGTLILSGGLLAVYLFVPTLRDILVAPESDDDKETRMEWENRGRFSRGWMSIAISLVAAFFFGFIFLIPVSFISYMLLLGRKTMFIKILLLSLGTALLVYIVFDHFLGIPTMHGFLWTL